MKSNVPEESDPQSHPLKKLIEMLREKAENGGECQCEGCRKGRREDLVRNIAKKLIEKRAFPGNPEPKELVQHAFALAEAFADECDERMKKLFPKQWEEFQQEIAEKAKKKAAEACE